MVPQECGEWTEKEGVSRKRKKKTYEQREASASMVTQCMQLQVAHQHCYALTTKTPISYFHDLSLDLFLSGLVWLQICYAEVQSSMIDGYLAFLKVRYLF